jgi:hypothetical protein
METVNNDNLNEEIKEAELMRKNDITLYGKALEEVKDFSFVMRTLIIKFYSVFLSKDDIINLAEDILRLAINIIVSD